MICKSNVHFVSRRDSSVGLVINQRAGQQRNCGNMTVGMHLLGEEKSELTSRGGHPQLPHYTAI
jgi:hypothetical protein